MGKGNTSIAVLADGKQLEYVVKDDPPRGGMKYTYFSPDKSYVVQFFNDPANARDVNIHKRLEAIIGKYNPTLAEEKGGARGNSELTAKYFQDRFCWPTALVQSPEFGIVCPAYPKNYFFNENSTNIDGYKEIIKGKDKKSTYFTSPKLSKYLAPTELGDFRSMLSVSINLARAIRRMHQAGLAHSDLSCNNVLIDPQTGTCVVIDIDSLVVPGLYPPEVIGTSGYIAPEVLETLNLPLDDPGRKLPCLYTDLHSMPVLIYEYLMQRHPLRGPKVYSTASAEEDDYLALGPKATFIEHPTDHSNRPKDLKYTIKDLGPDLENLFVRAFVDGLHNPNERPTAMEWEKGLVKTWDMLYQCSNPNCTHKWFVLHDVRNPVCPFCKTRIKEREFVRLKFKSEIRGRNGQWVDAGEINAFDNMPLFKWHIFSNCFPDEKTDRSLQASVHKYQGKWIMVNRGVPGMLSPSGNVVPIGQAVLLDDGTVFRASKEEKGYLIEASVVHV